MIAARHEARVKPVRVRARARVRVRARARARARVTVRVRVTVRARVSDHLHSRRRVVDAILLDELELATVLARSLRDVSVTDPN